MIIQALVKGIARSIEKLPFNQNFYALIADNFFKAFPLVAEIIFQAPFNFSSVRDFFQRRATRKCVYTDRSQTVGNYNFFQTATIAKCKTADRSPTLANNHSADRVFFVAVPRQFFQRVFGFFVAVFHKFFQL